MNDLGIISTFSIHWELTIHISSESHRRKGAQANSASNPTPLPTVSFPKPPSPLVPSLTLPQKVNPVFHQPCSRSNTFFKKAIIWSRLFPFPNYLNSSNPNRQCHRLLYRALVKPTDVMEDFSKARQPSQILVSTFYTSIEPYLRPIKEEDLGFSRIQPAMKWSPISCHGLDNIILKQWEDEDIALYDAVLPSTQNDSGDKQLRPASIGRPCSPMGPCNSE